MTIAFQRPVLLGHRGAPRKAPENTLASFAAALDAGLDGLELDVQRTADGVLAVHHDPALEGVALSEMRWEELKSRAPSVPRFEEVLELLQTYPDAYLNIELKSPFTHRDGREEALAASLRNWNGKVKARSWISSFDPLALLKLHRLGVALPLALLTDTAEILDLLPCLPVAGVHPKYDLVSAERVQAWHDAGLFVFVWTVNDEALARTLIEQGVDGLISDDHELILAARGNKP